MKTTHIYDPALCCSSGVCGTDVDQPLREIEPVATPRPDATN